MKYSISNWIYGNEPLRVTFQRLQKYGYDGVELVGEPQRYDIQEVKGLCQEFGLSVLSVIGWSTWPLERGGGEGMGLRRGIGQDRSILC